MGIAHTAVSAIFRDLDFFFVPLIDKLHALPSSGGLGQNVELYEISFRSEAVNVLGSSS